MLLLRRRQQLGDFVAGIHRRSCSRAAWRWPWDILLGVIQRHGGGGRRGTDAGHDRPAARTRPAMCGRPGIIIKCEIFHKARRPGATARAPVPRAGEAGPAQFLPWGGWHDRARLGSFGGLAAHLVARHSLSRSDGVVMADGLDQLRERIRDGKATVGIVGLGYVGLPLAVEVARSGLRVLGCDINAGGVRRHQRREEPRRGRAGRSARRVRQEGPHLGDHRLQAARASATPSRSAFPRRSTRARTPTSPTWSRRRSPARRGSGRAS